MNKPTWKHIKVKLSEIKGWERNPRQSTKAQQKRLNDSKDEFGQPIPFLLMPKDADGLYPLLDGHQRKDAWKEGEYHAMVSDRILEEKEREKLVITLHSGATGQYDWDLLSGWDVDELIDWGMDDNLLDTLNNDANNIKEMLAAEEEHADAEPQTDRAEELLEKWQVKTGDLWQIGEHRLICGDCTDAAVVARVMGGEKADMVTDPPYGMNLDTDWSGITGSLKSAGAKSKTTGRKYDKVIGDDKQYDPSFLFEIESISEMFLFGADYYAEYLLNKNEGSWLVWDKRKDTQADAFGAEFELIWSKEKHKRRMLRHDWFGFLSSENSKDASNRVHPTQKPVSLIEDIIKQWCKESVIADFYIGSGTTMVASQNLGRRCFAAEISPKYVSVCLQRMQDAFPELVIERMEI